ncbi:MAG: globin [Rhodoblastus sp.]|jgi:hemoglobin-like flavoprotein
MRADLITQSLELAAARAPDLTPLVYERLFAERPELAPMFGANPRLVQGEMLARALETILDFIGDRAYAANLVEAEAAAHATYEVPPDLFVHFFGVIADTLRALIGADWTGEMEAAWRDLVADMSACATQLQGVPA